MSAGLVFLAIVAILVFIAIIKTAVIVPQKSAFIVERLGKYRCTLDAGFHILLPFFDRIAYRRDLKEHVIDVPPQQCITKDNIAVDVDGVLYLQVMDPAKACYGIGNYLNAATQLAQTTMRSEMGKLDLDRSFEERTNINAAVVAAVDKASDPWGVKVTRYEIKNITPPQTIRDAMEKQMRAEREKRAMIAESEGERQSKINRAEGERQEAIALSEGERARRINEAEGRAKEILLVAEAQAEGIAKVAAALRSDGGLESVNMQLAQQYLKEFGNLAKTNNTMIIPSNLADVAGVLKACTSVVKKLD
ncbi:MAG: SPFH/Band 7/PHB domain protein [Kiritimatiellae bacterium]|nr:SPFH/Band 7/PHB domain protein [Kiritimatiellia bacterium]